MSGPLQPLLAALTTSPWPATADAFATLLVGAGYRAERTTGPATHWTNGALPATVCVEPAVGALFLDAVMVALAAPEDDADAYDRVHETVAGRYHELMAQASAVLGPPAFEGSFDAPGFPEDQDAVRLAAWQQGDTACYLAFRDDGPIAPIRVELTLDVTG